MHDQPEARQVQQVLLAQAGDRGALDVLLRELQAPLHAYLTGLAHDPHAAEDLLQETFLQIYRKLTWLRRPEFFRAWCYRIATRLAYRRLSRQRGPAPGLEPEQLEQIAQNEPPVDAFPSEWVGRLPALVEGLSPASRPVLVLHYFERLSIDEVSVILELPPGTIKSRLAFGLAALRQRFLAEFPDSARRLPEARP